MFLQAGSLRNVALMSSMMGSIILSKSSALVVYVSSANRTVER